MVTTKRIAIVALLFIGMQITTPVFAAVKITAEQAKSIALKAVNTDHVGPVTSIELEKEQGVTVFTVEFTKDGIETDVKINAENGQVVLIQSDKDKADKE